MLRSLIIVSAIAGLCLSPAALTAQPNAAELAQSGATVGAEQRSALVIGNAAYTNAPLKNPVNDAKAMAATLQRLGYEAVLVTDASLRQMQQAILDFGETLKGGGAGLFFYAGHGLQVKGQNYLVPVDAEITSEAAVRVEALPVDLVAEQMGDAANRVNIIILDACRNNPFERRLRGGSRGLAAMDAARGTLVAYATAPGSVAMDGDGENGLYTSELLKALSEPDLKAEEVFKRVRANLVRRTGGKQTPWESSSLTGDFVFNLTINLPPAVVGAGGGFDERQIELAYWTSVKDSTSAAAFRAYLEQYPKGTFAALARLRIEELESKQQHATPATKVGEQVVSFDEIEPGPLSRDAFASLGVQLLQGQGAPGVYKPEPNMVLPKGRHQVLLVAGDRETSLTIAFNPPIERFGVTRIGTAGGASVPTWTLRAYDTEGTVIDSTGEEHGLPSTPRQVSVEGRSIVQVQLGTDNRFGDGTWATWNSLPVAEFKITR